MNMARIIITCGKICSGKTTYAKRLVKEIGAVHLSVDDITLLLLGPFPGDILDEYVEKLEGYFLEKSLEIAAAGNNVVIDLGLWTRLEREDVREFYRKRGAECELHYIKIPDKVWRERIEKRNRDVEAGLVQAYLVDENLQRKFESWFEEPTRDEVDEVIEYE